VVLGSPVVPSIHVYARLLPSSVPLPNVVVPEHDGAPPQLPKGIQVGQEPTHKPDVHLISVGNPVYSESHVYIRIFPSAAPVPDAEAFVHVGASLQLGGRIQLGHSLSQSPLSSHVRVLVPAPISQV